MVKHRGEHFPRVLHALWGNLRSAEDLGAGAAADSQSVLVGSSSLALWSVVEQKRLAKFTGHAVSPSLSPCHRPLAAPVDAASQDALLARVP